MHQVSFAAGSETQSSSGEQCAVGWSESGYSDWQWYHPGNGTQGSDSKSLIIKHNVLIHNDVRGIIIIIRRTYG